MLFIYFAFTFPLFWNFLSWNEIQYNPGSLGAGINGELPLTVSLLRSQILKGFFNTELTWVKGPAVKGKPPITVGFHGP